MTRPACRLLLLLLGFALGSEALVSAQSADPALIAKAKAIHERVITLDTQVNLPKMQEGGLDAAFFIVYVGQGPLTPEGYDKAYAQAVAKFDAIHRQAIAEMNRVGFMIDLSHPSKQSNLQAIALSKAPVIASHSSARAVTNHSRNLDDEQLLAIRKNGGVVQAVAFDGYVKIKPPDSPARAAALAEARKAMPVGGPGEMTDEARARYRARMAEVNRK